MDYQALLNTAARNAAPKPSAPAEHPMVKQLLAAAALWRDRTDSFATGKEETCRDMALTLLKRGDFASEKQAGYAAKLVEWSKPRAAAAKPAADVLEVPRLFSVLQKHSTFHAGQLKISRKNQDSLCWLVWGTTCVGKIEDGKVVLFSARMRQLPPVEGMSVETNVIATLREFEADPLKTAITYGKLSGRCCSCGRDLTDPASIEAGIGPVCAGKFG